ncbi:MAG: hypothetical protein CVU84_16445 [Firmicutes bacterium HGW-Firmicutes-1]|jgi:hypothetical protein|nr:MAG: hypothetical protein CVU84_16445 [Firmicutes bacterium HGW-Firmicutes-1]
MFFNRMNTNIEKWIGVYLEAVTNSYSYYMSAMEKLLVGTDTDTTKQLMQTMEEYEKKADEIRRQIIRQMLEGGILVDTRVSLLRMIEDIDRIVGICEDIIQEIYMQNMIIHDIVKNPIREIHEITNKQLDLMVYAVKGTVEKYDVNEMLNDIREIEKLETKVDIIEHDIIKKVFDLPIGLAEKTQMRTLIGQVGNLADIIEDVSDEIEIIMMTRRV